MPDLDLSRETTADAGSGQDAAQPSPAGLAACLQERQEAVTGQHPWEQEQLAERLNRVVDAVKDRVDPRQLDAFRQGQTDQLRERQDGSRQLCEAAQLAVAQLEQRQQLTDERPGQQRDVSRPSERQQTGLVDQVNRMLSDLSKMQDQQNACLRQQRQDALAAAAPGAGGDLSRALDRQRADRAALRDQLSQMRQDLDRASRDLAAVGRSAGDARRPAGQGPAAQRPADTEREQRGQRVTGEAGRIGPAASLPERQQRPERMVSGPDRREQVRLQDRLDQLGERAKGRVDPHQLDAFRQGQLDQLRERQDASRQLREAVRAAAAQLDQQEHQRQQVTADGQRDRPRDLSGLRDQQRAGLVDLVNQVLSQLSGARDQQNACLRRQYQDALAAAAPGAGGDLSRALDRQRGDRDALRDQLSQIRQDLDRASRNLAGHADRQQQQPRQPGYDAARLREQPEAHRARYDATPRPDHEASRDVTAQARAAAGHSVTEGRRADAQDLYRTTANLAKANFGERMAAAALARDGHQILFFKPSILETNQSGIDICSYKDGLVYLVDNKAFTSGKNIDSVSSLTTNLAKSIDDVERDLAAMAADVTRSPDERKIIGETLTALLQQKYVKVVTNAALTENAYISTGVTQALARQGIQFIDVFQVTGNRDGLRGHL